MRGGSGDWTARSTGQKDRRCETGSTWKAETYDWEESPDLSLRATGSQGWFQPGGGRCSHLKLRHIPGAAVESWRDPA